MQPVLQPASQQRELNSLSMVTVIVLLAAVTMTFGALIAVFMIRSTSPQFWGHIRMPSILWASTAALLASSVVFEVGRHRLTAGDQRSFFRFTGWTTALGTLFLIGQVTAWLQVLHTGVILAHNTHSWFIFLFTGLHALHIVAGLAGLSYLLVRTRQEASGPRYNMHTRAMAIGVAVFWHYLDFMWVLLFALLLFWRR